jgi:hypothetical protein
MKVMFLTVGTYDQYVLTCHLNDNLSVRMTDVCLSVNADESYPVCLPVITDDSQCLPVGTDDRCACLYSRIVRIRSTGNVHPVSHTLQNKKIINGPLSWNA